VQEEGDGVFLLWDDFTTEVDYAGWMMMMLMGEGVR